MSNIHKDSAKLDEIQKKRLILELKKLESLLITANKTQHGIIYRLVYNSSQRLDEISIELQRIEAIFNFFRLKNEAGKVQSSIEQRIEIANLLARLDNNLIQKVNQFKDDKKAHVDDCFARLTKLVNIELTQEEKTMIVAAMALGKGINTNFK